MVTLQDKQAIDVDNAVGCWACLAASMLLMVTIM